jgi:hypothetical protein
LARGEMLNGRELVHGAINRIRKSKDDPIFEICTRMRGKRAVLSKS